MKKAKSIIIVLAVVFVTVSAAYAQPQGGYQQRDDKQKEHIFKELNLTPEQLKKLEENRKAQRQEVEKLFSALKEKQARLQETLKNPAVTRAIVDPLANEIKSLQAQLIDHRIGGIFAVKEILTPGQFAKFQQMMEKPGEVRKRRFQNWFERRKGASQGQKELKPAE